MADYIAIKDTVKGIERTIPIEIYVNQKDKEAAKKTFANVKDFFHAYEKAFGPYVWERIGYVATPFKRGAMEHATNIAYSGNCNGTMNCEYTLAHELSQVHQMTQTCHVPVLIQTPLHHGILHVYLLNILLVPYVHFLLV